MATGEARVAVLRDDPPPHHHPHARQEPARLSAGASVATSLAAGAVAGALAKTTIAPLDRTKINFQISQTPYSWRAAIEWVFRSARQEGVLALWRGNSATMARILPYAAIQFAAHDHWKRVLGVEDPRAAKQQPFLHFAAGSLAGVTSQSATYPLDLARARMAVTDAHEYRTLRQVFAKIVRTEGPRTLYRGFPATVLGVIPYAGVSFFTYDTLKHMYLEVRGGQSAWLNAGCGAAAGALAQTASYPLDIVRRRMQTGRRSARGDYRYPTIAATLQAVYASEGWRGFFKGLSMNWVKGPIAVGVSFASYDAVKAALRDAALSLRV